jgi:drug/metabolite transporter (DMT)-like permease
MTAGIAAGFASVLLLCGSYVFSRSYIRKHKDSIKLSVYSQLVMAVGGIALLAVTLPFVDYPLCKRFWGFVGGIVCTFLLGQTSLVRYQLNKIPFLHFNKLFGF